MKTPMKTNTEWASGALAQMMVGIQKRGLMGLFEDDPRDRVISEEKRQEGLVRAQTEAMKKFGPKISYKAGSDRSLLSKKGLSNEDVLDLFAQKLSVKLAKLQKSGQKEPKTDLFGRPLE